MQLTSASDKYEWILTSRRERARFHRYTAPPFARIQNRYPLANLETNDSNTSKSLVDIDQWMIVIEFSSYTFVISLWRPIYNGEELRYWMNELSYNVSL